MTLWNSVSFVFCYAPSCVPSCAPILLARPLSAPSGAGCRAGAIPANKKFPAIKLTCCQQHPGVCKHAFPVNARVACDCFSRIVSGWSVGALIRVEVWMTDGGVQFLYRMKVGRGVGSGAALLASQSHVATHAVRTMIVHFMFACDTQRSTLENLQGSEPWRCIRQCLVS